MTTAIEEMTENPKITLQGPMISQKLPETEFDICRIPWLQGMESGGPGVSFYADDPVQVFNSKVYDRLTSWALYNGLAIRETSSSRLQAAKNSTINPDFVEELSKLFKVFCLGKKQHAIDPTSENDYDAQTQFTYLHESGILELRVFRSNIVAVSYCFSEDIDVKLSNFLSTYIKKPSVPQSSFSMVTVQGQSMDFEQLRIPTMKFNPLNYTPRIVAQYEEIVDSFNAPGKGKLLIMQGEPGTGKSSIIRSLMEDMKDQSTFIFLPTNMLTQIVTPSFLPALIRESESDKSKVLIIEDADDCLVERATDNLGIISTLLNMTSGLLGDSLNLRVIATTNMKKADIDPALTRSGRLFDLMEFEALGPEQAYELLVSLSDKDSTTIAAPKSGILADIYATAAASNKKKKVMVDTNVSVITTKKIRKFGF